MLNSLWIHSFICYRESKRFSFDLIKRSKNFCNSRIVEQKIVTSIIIIESLFVFKLLNSMNSLNSHISLAPEFSFSHCIWLRISLSFSRLQSFVLSLSRSKCENYDFEDIEIGMIDKKNIFSFYQLESYSQNWCFSNS